MTDCRGACVHKHTTQLLCALLGARVCLAHTGSLCANVRSLGCIILYQWAKPRHRLSPALHSVCVASRAQRSTANVRTGLALLHCVLCALITGLAVARWLRALLLPG